MISLAKPVTVARCTANAQRISTMQAFNSLKKQSVKSGTLNLQSVKNGMTYAHKTRSGHDLILRKIVGSGYAVEYWHGRVYIHRCFFPSKCSKETLSRVIKTIENMIDNNLFLYSFDFNVIFANGVKPHRYHNNFGKNRDDAKCRLLKYGYCFQNMPVSLTSKIKNRV